MEVKDIVYASDQHHPPTAEVHNLLPVNTSQDAQLMMPRLDLTQTLRTNPDLILGLQKGRHLIPYELPNQ